MGERSEAAAPRRWAAALFASAALAAAGAQAQTEPSAAEAEAGSPAAETTPSAAAAEPPLEADASTAVAAALTIPSGVYEMDPNHASLVWRVQHLGLAFYTGLMTEFDATLTLDVDAPTNSSVTVVVETPSVVTTYQGAKDFDAELGLDPRFLNGNAHPQAVFTSTKVERTGGATATITGDLTLLGVTRRVTFEATLNGALDAYPLPTPGYQGRPAIGLSATGSFDRTSFGMGFLAPTIVGATVELRLDADFVMADPAPAAPTGGEATSEGGEGAAATGESGTGQ